MVAIITMIDQLTNAMGPADSHEYSFRVSADPTLTTRQNDVIARSWTSVDGQKRLGTVWDGSKSALWRFSMKFPISTVLTASALPIYSIRLQHD